MFEHQNTYGCTRVQVNALMLQGMNSQKYELLSKIILLNETTLSVLHQWPKIKNSFILIAVIIKILKQECILGLSKSIYVEEYALQGFYIDCDVAPL